MNISYNWLSDIIDHQMSVEDLSALLTDIGLEVGKVHPYVNVPGGLEGVVIGKVKTCEQHPDADRLSVTTVDLGAEEPVQIVCGAPNVDAGQTVAVATVGTTLYGEDGSHFKIKKAKIRGQISQGMICAEDELHLGASHDGIMVLPDDLVAGTPASDYFQVEHDHIIDIDLTPNRSDATSHYGCALDVAAALKIRSENHQNINFPEVELNIPDNDPINIRLLDAERCPRYTGICIDDVTIKPSPKWLQDRLNSIGVRPINNIVDITNYILHGYGQPLHAFDRDKIADDTIKVQTLPAGTVFKSLDEVDRSLYAEDLMICDGQDKPMCIGGVFGGIDSGVSDQTTRIFLESAHFDARSNRQSAVRHDLRTDAHKVFEKTHDIRRCIPALKLAVKMIVDLAGGRISSQVYDLYPVEKSPVQIDLRLHALNALSGHDFDISRVEEILSAMDMEYSSLADGQSWTITVPLDKADVLREVDIIEEIMRIHGFNNLNEDTKIKYSPDRVGNQGLFDVEEKIIQQCTGLGLQQAMSMSLTHGDEIEWLQNDPSKNVIINNTSNIRLNTLRPDMLVSALECVKYNHARRNIDLRLFEIGNVYHIASEDFVESRKLSMYSTGNRFNDQWNISSSPADAYFLKSIVEEFLKMNRVSYKLEPVEQGHMDAALAIVQGDQHIGYLGTVSSTIQKKYDVQGAMQYAEIDLSALHHAEKAILYVDTIPVYPATTRDLAFEVPSTMAYDALERVIREAARKILRDVTLVNVYEDDKLKADGKQSWAVRLTLQHDQKTLSDKEVDPVIKRILKKAQQELGIGLRN